MEPNPLLMSKYGTAGFYQANLEKKAQMPAALQIAGPMASLALYGAQRGRHKRQTYEAAVMSEMFRRLEAERQAAVVAGFRGEGVYSPQGQAASQLNQMAAYQAMMGLMGKRASAELQGFSQGLDDMSKEAFGASLLGKAVGGLGKVLGGVGRRAAGTAAQRAVGQAGAFSGLGMKMQQAGASLQQTGQQWARRGMGATGRLEQAAAKAGVPTPPRGGGAYRTPAKVPPTAAPAPVPTPTPPTPAPRTGASKPLIGWGTKLKILGGLGVAGTAYGGYKGLQTAKDYMMQPTYASQAWGGYGTAPPSQVGPGGYLPYAF